MNHSVNPRNQAVVFTKPLHHLNLPFSCQELNSFAAGFLEHHHLHIIKKIEVTGDELARRNVIAQHYYMYSKASLFTHPDELRPTDSARSLFKQRFQQEWDEQVRAGTITNNLTLMRRHNLTPEELFLRWNRQFDDKAVVKLQSGLLITWLESFQQYGLNGFYPSLEATFTHPATRMHYYVIEFDPAEVSWKAFREQMLGKTDASRADPQSLRGELYQRFKSQLHFPGRDNFVHGSAGPLESFIERSIHEPDFEMNQSPVGMYLQQSGVTLPLFQQWKAAQSLHQLGALFDATEEIELQEALPILEKIDFKNP
jgi:hypothetical protein